MRPTVLEQIDKFCDYFEERISKAAETSDKIFKKTMLMVLIDALSVAKYGSETGIKERFTNFIKECSDWKDCGRISLPQLLLVLTDDMNLLISKDDTALISYVKKYLSKWKSGHFYEFTDDPFPFEIEHIVNLQAEKSKVENSLHYNLFFEYRNTLVHEAREPGYGMELSSDSSRPYYHSICFHDDLGSDNTSNYFELVYPAEFIVKITKTLLYNVRVYLNEYNVNPYTQYKFSSIWRHKAR
jgi:hypothetical protein